jgi:hypothetical protein
MVAGHGPPGWFADASAAGGAGGWGAAFVDQVHGDPGEFGLVPQHRDRPADLPLPQPEVVPPAGVQVQDAAGVADRQRPDPLRHSRGDHGLRRFVLGLADPAVMPALDLPGAAARLAPPPWPALPRFRRVGGGGPAAGFRVREVHPVFGADRPPGGTPPF